MRQNRTVILSMYSTSSAQYSSSTEMLKFKPVHAYFAQVCSYCSFQILFTILVRLLLMSVDILSQKEFTRTKRKFEGLTQSIRG